MKIVKHILIGILLAIVALQFMQFISPISEVKELKGVVFTADKPELNTANWFNGEIQHYTDNYVNHNFGFRPYFIRLYNQIQFSLFGAIHNDGVVMGNYKFLYGKDYIKEYLGEDFLGSDSIAKQIRKLKKIEDYLSDHNTKVLVVLAPGKTYFYPEYLPQKDQAPATETNYYLFEKLLKQYGIQVMDVNKWFIAMKDTSNAPLFTQTGVHWSVYGARLVADSLIKRSAEILQKPMNMVEIKDYTMSMTYQNSDNDLADLLNLFSSIHDYPAAYPTFERSNEIPEEERPGLVVIADSFFWLLFDGILGNAYSSIDYYYYYSSVFSTNFEPDTKVSDLCIPCELRESDLVIIMGTTPSLKNFGYGFIDEFLLDIQPSAQAKIDSLTNHFVEVIKADSNWMELIRQKAIDKNFSIDTMIYLDAKYMARHKISKALNREN